MKPIFTIIIIFCLFVGTCKQISDPVSVNYPYGSYNYFGYDSLMIPVFKGWIKIELQDSIKITGSWFVEEIGNPKNIGPHAGEGNLIGGKTDTSIWINFHPNYIDNNIYIYGESDGNTIHGIWYWVTFAGITNLGNFNAKRN